MPETAQLLRESWRAAVQLGDDVPLLFYGVLFELAPDVAALFPPDMSEQRRHLIATLGTMVKTHGADRHNWQPTANRLRQLGKDHRRYGAEPEHYPVVAQALLETLEHFLGKAWTPEHAVAWEGAIATVAEVMADAAAEEKGPPWLDLEVARSSKSTELAAIELEPPEDDWPERYGLGADIWVRRPDRPSGWVRGRLPDGFDPPTVVFRLADLDSIVLAQTPQGAQLRLAPVFDLEAQ
jgi:hemoglobin-like flavoprotein